ncbi:hypothetical protein ACFFX1_47875 [Dactylosporangium sucinum]|uniref:Uncharacterized protein n=1 Tax=Dactylosporangium sucinum TaxID=1424081 RepID=A0A917TMP5_9ACTN|nr:hypothetical protein [Dactylosporangium sucinum]GGM29344.1 hypothetical protein GCM10007977_033300 [Dactylosporangium sucinum]
MALTAIAVPQPAHAATCTTNPRISGSFIQPVTVNGGSAWSMLDEVEVRKS